MGGLLDVLGGLTFWLLLLVMVFFPLPMGLAYLALRLRDARAAAPDPQLGLKTAFHLIHSLAVLMVLTGLSTSAGDLMKGKFTGNPPNQPVPVVGRPPPAPAPEEEFWTPTQRTAAALAATGALFGLAFGYFLTGTNNRKHPAVLRTFVGGRLVVCLLVVFAAVTATAVLMAQKDPRLEPVEALVGILIVWVPGAALHYFLFRLASRRPIEP